MGIPTRSSTPPSHHVAFPPTPATSPPISPSSSHLRIFQDLALHEEYPSAPELPPVPVPETPTEVLAIDANTADAHVKRDKRLVRLTGNHPFNVEAPLSLLFEKGFLTPPELFYVRNHGAVPRCEREESLDWEFTVEGLVDTPCTLTLRDLQSSLFPQVTLPITLVCAGNRRKEQNTVRKSQGFSWGPAGVSTSLFTGVLLSDFLSVLKPKRGAKYLCMEGADPLPNGYYGTSVRLSLAMDSTSSIMLSYAQNGEPLTPDHGFPLRVVVPGQIGGRSVKWLKRLIITDKPSDNWYHIHDNRVLPTMVNPQEARYGSDWWKDERYAIYDLSVNSAVARPGHGEVLDREAGGEYTVKGYAYSGGGRRVTRVEVSLDKGRSWRLADIEYPEDIYRHEKYENLTLYGGKLDMSWRDKSFCWCFWNLNVPVAEVASAKDIVVRAMDEAMNLQPKDMYWNILGMMNNPWFRIVIEKDSSGRFINFKHPTQPGTQTGGWMEETKKAGGDLQDGNWGEKEHDSHADSQSLVAPHWQNTQINMTNPLNANRVIEIEELRAHQINPEESCWFVVEDEVFEGVGFLKEHPGGAQSITSSAGLDVTEEFMAIHSENARGMMREYHVGRLSEDAKKALKDTSAASEDSEDSTTFLNPRLWVTAKLETKVSVSHDTRLFTFAFSDAKKELGLPVGQHLMVKLKDEKTGEVLVRAYTPTSEQNHKGKLELLVKIYQDTPTQPGGKMSQALDRLALGEEISIKGPIGKLTYHSNGNLTLNSHPRHVKRINMICAGTGITPIYQLLRAILSSPSDPTLCTVLYGNRTESDILLLPELSALQNLDPSTGKAPRCELTHTLTKAGEAWKGERGRIDRERIERVVGRRREGELVCVCGPEGLERVVLRVLGELGWGEGEICVF